MTRTSLKNIHVSAIWFSLCTVKSQMARTSHNNKNVRATMYVSSVQIIELVLFENNYCYI